MQHKGIMDYNEIVQLGPKPRTICPEDNLHPFSCVIQLLI